jgi:hypothetical protein
MVGRQEQLQKLISSAKEILDREISTKETQCLEVAYDAGIEDVDDAIDFMDCVVERGENCNPYELISDYMALLQ